MGGIYFASDGNYGPADGLVVVDTTWWSDTDWEVIEEAKESHRAVVAWAIARDKRGVKACTPSQ
jgi:hypothetical protein